jgi:hypothetical protein
VSGGHLLHALFVLAFYSVGSGIKPVEGCDLACGARVDDSAREFKRRQILRNVVITFD